MKTSWITGAGAAGLALTIAACSTTDPEARRATPVTDPATDSAPAAVADPLATFTDREIVSYTVKSGDTLWDIGRAHKVSVADIKTANALEKDMIFPEQTLKIPVANGTLPPADPAPAASATPIGQPAVAPVPARPGTPLKPPPPPPATGP